MPSAIKGCSVHAGGQTIAASAPLEIVPLFIRAGAILPLGPIGQHAEDQLDAPIELRIYPGADGRFSYYEDENDNYNYEKDQYATIEMQWNDLLGTLTLLARRGTFAGMLAERRFEVLRVKPGSGIGLARGPHTPMLYSGAALKARP